MDIEQTIGRLRVYFARLNALGEFLKNAKRGRPFELSYEDGEALQFDESHNFYLFITGMLVEEEHKTIKAIKNIIWPTGAPERKEEGNA